MSNLPYENIRVLDFGQYVAGPAAAVMFADLGAEVIRIDPPGGPRWDSPAAEVLNRRKKSIVLDLKAPGDRKIAEKLVATADVLIENFRPGVMAGFGLGPEEAMALNPALVYLSLPGFASTDEERSSLPAWEAVIAASCGQFTDMGLNRILMGVNPSFSPVTLASAYAALMAASAAAAALCARESHGFGDHIEVPVASALMEGLVYNSMDLEDLPERYKSLREREIDRRRRTDEAFDMTFEELQEYLDPFYRSYVCADGRPVYVVSSCHATHAHRTLEAMGLLDELLEAGLPELEDWYAPSASWPEGVDCAIGLYPLSKKWADRVSKRMKERFLEKTSLEWDRIFGEAGAPVAIHQSSREWLNCPHGLESGLVHEIDHPDRGRMRQAGAVAWLSDTADFAAAGTPAPALDADREEILASPAPRSTRSSAPAPIESGGASRPPEGRWLDGVKVLDMSNVIAGPMAGMTLARFGAEVIKLDPVKPTYDPWNTVLIGYQIHRGKRSMLTDLRSPGGRAVLDRLIRWADVVVFNGLERQMESLGISPASLESTNPRAVLCRLDCWGGPLGGPRSGYLGYDDLVQAFTGIMTRFGGSMDTPEEHAHLGTIDVLTGFSASFAALSALFRRFRTGKGGVARTSLNATGQLLQIPFMHDYAGRAPFDEPSGRETNGDGPLYRCYEASDGWFFLAAPNLSPAVLEGIPELRGAGGLRGPELESFLAGRFLTRPRDFWIPPLLALDAGAVAMGSLAEIRERYVTAEPMDSRAKGGTFQFTRFADHPGGRRVDLVDPCAIRPRFAELAVLDSAGKFGADTRTILAGLGFEPEEIEKLFGEEAVAEGWGGQYLPD